MSKQSVKVIGKRIFINKTVAARELRIINERTKAYNDLRVIDQIREKEIQDLYASLGHKD
jgi:hypothetical protein